MCGHSWHLMRDRTCPKTCIIALCTIVIVLNTMPMSALAVLAFDIWMGGMTTLRAQSYPHSNFIN